MNLNVIAKGDRIGSRSLLILPMIAMLYFLSELANLRLHGEIGNFVNGHHASTAWFWFCIFMAFVAGLQSLISIGLRLKGLNLSWLFVIPYFIPYGFVLRSVISGSSNQVLMTMMLLLIVLLPLMVLQSKVNDTGKNGGELNRGPD